MTNTTLFLQTCLSFLANLKNLVCFLQYHVNNMHQMWPIFNTFGKSKKTTAKAVS